MNENRCFLIKEYKAGDDGMNETAKVGAFTVGGLMAFSAATMSLSNVNFGIHNHLS